MKIAVASGKGGTGKTTVATNLALTASLKGYEAAYLDCDVEEPNGHIFLKPELREKQGVGNLIPEVDSDICIHCNKCGEICQYNAIVSVHDKTLVFPELCHACGGCALVCPAGAITEVSRDAGYIETGFSGNIGFVHGMLNIGEVMSPGVIKAVKKAVPEKEWTFIDSPPGTSCPVIESVKDADFVVLVTEPTPFGLNDLELAVKMVRKLGIAFGVVVNRMEDSRHLIREFCSENKIDILAEIPDDRKIAETYSRGMMICEAIPQYSDIFENLLRQIKLGIKGQSGKEQEI